MIEIGVKFEEEYQIKINDTILMIGSIIETFLFQDCLMNDGFIDIEKVSTVTISGLDSYHKAIRLACLSFGKPGLPLTEIEDVI